MVGLWNVPTEMFTVRMGPGISCLQKIFGYQFIYRSPYWHGPSMYTLSMQETQSLQQGCGTSRFFVVPDPALKFL